MYARQGVNKDYIKARNRGLVLQLICCSAEAALRSVITESTGLSKMAVTNIVNELIEADYVIEGEHKETPHVGRNPILLNISPRSPRIIGLHVARTQLSAIVADLCLRIEYEYTVPLANETAQTFKEKLLRAADAAAAHLNGHTLLGIGVSSLGPIDRTNGVLLNPTNFFTITDFPISAALEQRFGAAVITDNDMNASALAERLYGGGRSLRNFLYVGITNGIGAGIITDGALYPDLKGLSGEIGHLCVEVDGTPCSCGNRGCLEAYANMPVILSRLSHAAGRAVSPCEFTKLYDLPACRTVFDDAARYLTSALTGVSNLLNPECIFLGHDAVHFPNAFLQTLRERLNNAILARGYTQIAVARSSFGADSALKGSVSLVCDALFRGKL